MLCVAAGCTTRHREFAGHPSETVWATMKSVAQAPTYTDWVVLENNVWVDEPGRRIEIDRYCRRDLQHPRTRSLRENRHWKFTIELEKLDPPTAEFVSRDFGVPAHAWNEADRYFAEVAALLMHPGVETPAPEGDLAPAPPAEGEAPAPVDVDAVAP
jgi:hypothetical protein